MSQVISENKTTEGVTPEQVQQVKTLIVKDIQRRLETGQMLVHILSNFDIDIRELESPETIAKEIASLLYKLYNVSESSLHEGNIIDFLTNAIQKGFTISDINVYYDVRRYSSDADILIYLGLPNGYMSGTIQWVDSKLDTAILSKSEYQQYVAMVETVKAFLSNIKKLAEEVAKPKVEEEEE